MSRKARVKSPESIYHIMCRSISEILLFRDDQDKEYYLCLLKRYIDKYQCSLYAYCLMDNHVHLHLDPKGFDVSKFMHSLNTAYVRYYNKKYCRHGHVFQGRFGSRILHTDAHNLIVSAYIHNNPHDIKGFSGREEAYPYSSYGIYLGIRRDVHGLIDKSFMRGLFGAAGRKAFVRKYAEYVSRQRDIEDLNELYKTVSTEAENEYISGRKVILRDHSPSKVVSFISGKLMLSPKSSLAVKSKRNLQPYRAFTAYALRVLCGLGYRDICSAMYNITISGCSRLCSKGYELLEKDPFYASIFDELVEQAA